MGEHERVEQVSVYRPIFAEIEAIPSCAPIDAYRLYYMRLRQQNLDPSIYISMAITSGGYVRDHTLDFGEALDKNGQFGTLIAAAAQLQFEEHDINQADIVVPSDLGKVSDWGQAEYLVFWAHVITGFDPIEASEIEHHVQQSGVMQLAGFADKSLPREERWADYSQLVESYVNAITVTSAGKRLAGIPPPRNMQAILLGLDPSESLGVNAERYLCYLLGFYESRANIPEAFTEAVDASTHVAHLGATVPTVGQRHIVGRQNQQHYWALRQEGFRFRAGGLIKGIMYRKYDEQYVAATISSDTVKSEELWREYYAHKDCIES